MSEELCRKFQAMSLKTSTTAMQTKATPFWTLTPEIHDKIFKEVFADTAVGYRLPRCSHYENAAFWFGKNEPMLLLSKEWYTTALRPFLEHKTLVLQRPQESNRIDLRVWPALGMVKYVLIQETGKRDNEARIDKSLRRLFEGCPKIQTLFFQSIHPESLGRNGVFTTTCELTLGDLEDLKWLQRIISRTSLHCLEIQWSNLPDLHTYAPYELTAGDYLRGNLQRIECYAWLQQRVREGASTWWEMRRRLLRSLVGAPVMTVTRYTMLSVLLELYKRDGRYEDGESLLRFWKAARAGKVEFQVVED